MTFLRIDYVVYIDTFGHAMSACFNGVLLFSVSNNELTQQQEFKQIKRSVFMFYRLILLALNCSLKYELAGFEI